MIKWRRSFMGIENNALKCTNTFKLEGCEVSEL